MSLRHRPGKYSAPASVSSGSRILALKRIYGSLMLSDDVMRSVAEQIGRVEQRLLALMEEGRVRQEPDMTSRLVHGLEIASDEVDGVTVEFTVIDGIGPGAAERSLGADVLGVVRIEVGGLLVSKGFLAQSKRSGVDGLRLVGPSINDYSHWLYRGGIELEQSGTVEVTRPSPHLEEQCDHMLRVTPDSFVIVFGDAQIGVVSASAIHAHRSGRARVWKKLGTKRLDDFFLHVVDCYVGDPALAAATVGGLRAEAERRGASAAMMLRVVAQPTP